MAKNILNESTIRRFMKLAKLEDLSQSFLNERADLDEQEDFVGKLAARAAEKEEQEAQFVDTMQDVALDPGGTEPRKSLAARDPLGKFGRVVGKVEPGPPAPPAEDPPGWAAQMSQDPEHPDFQGWESSPPVGVDPETVSSAAPAEVGYSSPEGTTGVASVDDDLDEQDDPDDLSPAGDLKIGRPQDYTGEYQLGGGVHPSDPLGATAANIAGLPAEPESILPLMTAGETFTTDDPFSSYSKDRAASGLTSVSTAPLGPPDEDIDPDPTTPTSTTGDAGLTPTTGDAGLTPTPKPTRTPTAKQPVWGAGKTFPTVKKSTEKLTGGPTGGLSFGGKLTREQLVKEIATRVLKKILKDS